MSIGKILLIEDDASIAMLEKDYLEIEGYEVSLCDTGTAGEAAALKGGWDLILLDLMLPGMNGFDLFRSLRDRLDVPMMVVSARTEDIDKVRALGLGADDYLTKPFSPAELVARVKSHIRRYQRLSGKGADAEDLVSGGLMINPLSHRVFADGREVTLTTKEFELLFFLASNPDIVFSRDQLFERIWGIEHYGDVGTVAVHIQKIRKKIEKDCAQPQYIETVWGTGYRFRRT